MSKPSHPIQVSLVGGNDGVLVLTGINIELNTARRIGMTLVFKVLNGILNINLPCAGRARRDLGENASGVSVKSSFESPI